MSNPINVSGKLGEENFEHELIKNKIPYKKHKYGKSQIDFIINHQAKNKKDRFYIDIKNQHTSGGRDGAVAYSVWNYKKKYGFDECYIVEGSFDFPNKIREFANEQSKVHFVKLNEMIKIILEKFGKEIPKAGLDKFI